MSDIHEPRWAIWDARTETRWCEDTTFVTLRKLMDTWDDRTSDEFGYAHQIIPVIRWSEELGNDTRL